MAGWISSKLKVAETFLQQIDQQAAKSLWKNDRPRPEDESVDSPLTRTESIPLKDQLKKKSLDGNAAAHGNLHLESSAPEQQWKRSDSTEKPGPSVPKSDGSTSATPVAAVERDWAELHGSPDPVAAVGSRPKRNRKKHDILVSAVDMLGEISFEDIVAATNNFLEAQMVAKLGFGTAYHGYLWW